jgi:ADP-ribose pyrophosphatase YjhB (NUDIX family)
VLKTVSQLPSIVQRHIFRSGLIPKSECSVGKKGRVANSSFMSIPEKLRWLDWTSRLQALAQNGLTFTHDSYDVERYKQVREIAAEMIAAGSGLDLVVIRNLLSQDSGYATPKVDVRGVVFRENKLLLVKEISDGRWALPGGWADVCGSPAENVVREIQEESGFQTRAVKILAVFDRSKHPHEPAFPYHVYKMFILCEMISGVATPSSETDAVNFFAQEELPELSVTRVTPGQIYRMFEHHRDPRLPTDFDK